MFGSWIVVVKTVRNFYKLGYINQNICVNTGNCFLLLLLKTISISGQQIQQSSRWIRSLARKITATRRGVSKLNLIIKQTYLLRYSRTWSGISGILTKDVQFDCFPDSTISHSIIGFTNIITRLGTAHVVEH